MKNMTESPQFQHWTAGILQSTLLNSGQYIYISLCMLWGWIISVGFISSSTVLKAHLHVVLSISLYSQCDYSNGTVHEMKQNGLFEMLNMITSQHGADSQSGPIMRNEYKFVCVSWKNAAWWGSFSRSLNDDSGKRGEVFTALLLLKLFAYWQPLL